MTDDFSVRVQWFTADKNWDIKTIERHFKTAGDRWRWLRKNNDKIVNIIGYTDPW